MNKIKQYFFYKDGEFSWWKSIQNILLIYVVSYLSGLYYDLFYNPSVTRISMDCLDCALPVMGMGILCYILLDETIDLLTRQMLEDVFKNIGKTN